MHLQANTVNTIIFSTQYFVGEVELYFSLQLVPRPGLFPALQLHLLQ